MDITNKVLESAGMPAETMAKLTAAHTLGLFRVVLERDEHFSFADLCGDTYNPAANPDIPAEQLKKEKAAYRSRVNRQGVWGAVLELRAATDEQFNNDQSIWGFVGMDFVGSGYDTDFCLAAVEWLTENLDRAKVRGSVQTLVDAVKTLTE